MPESNTDPPSLFDRLTPSTTPGSEIARTPKGGVTLKIPGGQKGNYRLAQLDDYRGLARQNFLWSPPFKMHLHARVSGINTPGTWGFGVWNVPVSFNLGFGSRRILPALPNAAWFFFSSPENYLSLEDRLPPNGPTAATFRAAKMPFPLLAFGTLGLPFLALPSTARLLRSLAKRLVRQDGARLNVDPTEWHTYELHWTSQQVIFTVDQTPVLATPISPHGPLGFVLWIDNQFMAFPPHGRLSAGTLANKTDSWVEVTDLKLVQGGPE